MNIKGALIALLLCSCPFAHAAEFQKNELSALSKKADVVIRAMLDSKASEYKEARVYKLISNK